MSNDSDTTHALLSYSTNNIGDDFQSYAMDLLYPTPIKFDRDSPPSKWMSREERLADHCKLLANGMFNNIPQYSNMLLLSVAMTKQDKNSSISLDEVGYLVRSMNRHNGFFGCRDRKTFEWVEKMKRALGDPRPLWTGCPSVLLNRQKLMRKLKCDGPSEPNVVYVDVDPQIVPESFRSGAPRKVFSNWCKPTLTPRERKEAVEERLRAYIGATLVVTNRIHVALPCWGLGVDVVLTDFLAHDPEYRFTVLPESYYIHSEQEIKNLKWGNRLDTILSLNRARMERYKERVSQNVADIVTTFG